MTWAEQEARRRGLSDPIYVRYRQAEEQVAEAMRRVDEQVLEWARRRPVRMEYGRGWSED